MLIPLTGWNKSEENKNINKGPKEYTPTQKQSSLFFSSEEPTPLSACPGY